MKYALNRSADADFAAALSAELRLAMPAIKPRTVTPPVLRHGDIEIGAADAGGPIGLSMDKLTEGRLLIQGASGAGKSWTLRRLLEQTAGRIQQVIIDPEGEFRNIGETYGHLVIEARQMDTHSLTVAARRVREHCLSIIIDLSDMDRERQMTTVAAVLGALMDAPIEHWTPCLVALDEVHLFAPHGGYDGSASSVRKASIAAVTDLMSRGRKRGLTGVLATQRLVRLAKSVASEVHNFMIGLNTLDLDIRRAAETIGWDARRAFDRLPMLPAGEFAVVGPAFSRSPAVLRVGAVLTHHRGAAPALPTAAYVIPPDARALLGFDELMEASARDAAVIETNAQTPSLRAIRMFIRDPAFVVAAQIWGELRSIAPQGADVTAIGEQLQISMYSVVAALALLDGFGVLEFTGDGKAQVVRVAKGMLS